MSGAEGAALLPLTEAQEGLWVAQALAPANPIYNTGQYIELSGPLDLAAFARAHADVMEQAQALRLRFAPVDGAPRQWLGDVPALEVVDLSDRADPEAAALALMAEDQQRATDLAREPVARFILYAVGEERHFWYERIHHLATDGFAMVLVTDAVAAHYSALVRGEAPPAPLPPLSRATDEDASYRTDARRERDAAFWHQRMAGLDNVALPGRAAAGTADSFHRARMTLAPDAMAGLTARAEAAGLAWPDVLTTLTAGWLARICGPGEPVFGVPFMARLGTRAARVPCMWMNVLPFRCVPDEDAPLDDVLAAASADLALMRRHGRYRSEQLRRDLGRTGADARIHGPLINVQPFDTPPRFAGLEAHLHILGAGAVEDMTVTYRGDPVAGMTLEIDTNPDRFTLAETEAHLRRLADFLPRAVAAERLADVPTLPEDEHRRIVYELNATDHPVPEVSLAALIERQMCSTPEAPAVVFGHVTLTYAELDRRSAALAQALRARGAGRDRVVAVALERSEHLAVALVAVLRSGAAYLPLDPGHPPQRLRELIAAGEAVAVLAEPGLDCGTAPYAPSDWPTDARPGPLPEVAPDALAYVLFTSGSTGAPKGVMVEHRAIVNRLLWMRDHYGFGPADRILQKTPTTFDVSVWELFLPCLCGGTLVLAPPGAQRDPAALAGLIRARGITAVHFVPSMLSAFLAHPASAELSLHRVFCSGEALPADLRDAFNARVDAELHNLYGPTEAAVDVSFWEAGPQDRSDPLPIGHPVWNTRMHVLDVRLRPVPPGVPGELYLGGRQLARGYLGRPDLTAARFIPDRFRPGERLYATGDRAMLRDDGAVLYLGRADDQLKIRGMRTEPGEVAAAIRATGLVREAVVLGEDGPQGVRLVAWVVPAGAGDPSHEITRRLSEALPAHMVPSAIVAVQALPVTPSGKLDRRALPAPRVAATGAPAEGEVETRIAALVAEVLALDAPPGRDADFFALGGDSLSALRLCLVLEEAFGRDPGLGQLFAAPTVAGLAQAVGMGASGSGLDPLLPLTASGARAPLFLLPPAGGLGWGYRRLAQALHQGTWRPVLALQAPLLSGGALPGSLTGLAADYAARIGKARPEGMIHLAGWSVGGILAQEIAVQLAASGRRVGLVALLDAYPAEVWRAEPEPTPAAALRALLAIAGQDPDAHLELDTRSRVVAFLRRTGTGLGALPEPVLDAVVRLVTGTNRLIRAHHHRRWDGPLMHVRAARDHAGRGFEAALWAPHAAGVEAVDLPLLHREMVSDAAAEALAPLLAQGMAARER